MAFSQSFWETARKLWEGLPEGSRELLGVRVGAVFQRALNNGVAIFLSTSLLILLTGLFMTLAFSAFSVHHALLSSQINSILEVSADLSDSRFPSVAAVAFSTIRASKPPAVVDQIRSKMTELLDSKPHVNHRYSEKLQKDLQGYQDSQRLPEKNRTSFVPPSILALGLQQGRLSSVSIQPGDFAGKQLSTAALFPDKGTSGSQRKALWTAVIFGDAIESFGEQLRSSVPAKSNTTADDMTELFRVSLFVPLEDGAVIRTWRSLVTDKSENATAKRLWHLYQTPRYGAHFRKDGLDRIISFDPEGVGVILTSCNSVGVPGAGTVPVYLCIDTVPTVKALEKSALDSRITALSRVKFPIRVGMRLEASQLSWPDDLAQEFRDVKSGIEGKNFVSDGNDVIDISSTKVKAWLVPFSRADDSTAFGLVLTPPKRGSRAPVDVYLLLGIATATFVASFVLGMFGTLRARAAENAAMRLALLRGLQVGFLRISGSGQILEANFAAEAIFKQDLPLIAVRDRLQLSEVSAERRFQELIFSDVVLADVGGLPDARSGLISYLHLDRYVPPELPRSFFAELKDQPYTWIRLSSTPILEPGRKGGGVGVFATVERTRAADDKCLNEIKRGPEKSCA